MFGCWYCGYPLEGGEPWQISPDGAWHNACATVARLWEWEVSQHRRMCHLEGCDREPAYPFGGLDV